MFPGIVRPVTATTRPKRANEIDGRDYFFLDRKVFDRLIAEGRFEEYAEVHGNLYGTPTESFMAAWAKAHVWLQLDVQGAMQVKKKRTRTHFYRKKVGCGLDQATAAAHWRWKVRAVGEG